MKCESCGHSTLLAKVDIVKMVPLKDKGGNLAMAGVKVGQQDIKSMWTEKRSGGEKPVRGPIFCAECGEEHYYIPGQVPALHLGSMDQAEV